MEIILWIVIGAAAIAAGAVAYHRFLLWLFPKPILEDERHTVTAEDGWKVRLFRKRPDKPNGETVFLCHGAGGNRLYFLMPPGEGLANYLVKKGYDCWMVDLRGNRSSDPRPGKRRNDVVFEDYLYRDIPAVVDYILAHTGSKQIHWVGHSLGGMLLYGYLLAFGQDRIASGTAIASPPGLDDIIYNRSMALFEVVTRARRFTRFLVRLGVPFLRFLRPGGDIYPINWDNLHPRIGPTFFLHGFEVSPVALLRQLDRWASHRQWRPLDRNGAAWDLARDLRKIDIPLLLFSTAIDPFARECAVSDLYTSLETPDKELHRLTKEYGYDADYGHIDVALASQAQKDVFAPIADWLERHPAGSLPPRQKRALEERILQGPLNPPRDLQDQP